MLGQRYLETRTQLSEVLTAVASLAREAKVDDSSLHNEDIEECLFSPIRIAVLGDVGSGKTSFLNALMGFNACEEDDYTIYSYGSATKWSGRAAENIKHTQVDALGEIELIDTRGISKLNDAERKQLLRLLSETDHILWIVSAESPWASKTWDFITEARNDISKRSSVVLQKSDLIKKRDEEVLINHLTSLSVQRVGHALNIHSVSAVVGVEAWATQKRSVVKWRKSGFADLGDYLSDKLNSGEERRSALLYVSGKIRKVIDQVESSIRDKVRLLRSDKNSLQLVEAEVSRAREDEVENAKLGLQQMSAIITEHVETAVKIASKKNGFFNTLISLFGRGDGALEVERKLQEDVSVAAEVRSREIANNLLAKCEKQWRGLRDDLQKRMAVDVVGFDSKIFGIHVERFSQNMEDESKRVMTMLKLSRLLDRMMVNRRLVLRRKMCWLLSLTSAAGFLGFFEVGEIVNLPWLVLTIGGLLSVYMLIYSYRSRKTLLSAYRERLYNARFEFAEMMEKPYSEEMREFYTGYTSMFENLRQYIVLSEERLQPMHDEWHELFLLYNSVHQEI